MGEGGSIGAPAAVLNAINDTVAHLGIQFTSIPVSPAMVITALNSVGKGDAHA